MIADIVFDIPIDHAFSYVVPVGLALHRGQRVSAPLSGRSRVGVVVALREGETAGLKPLQRAVEPVPVLSDAGLELTRWAAGESLSSWGSTLLSLLPPAPRAFAAETVSPPANPSAGRPRRPELWTDQRREAHNDARDRDLPAECVDWSVRLRDGLLGDEHPVSSAELDRTKRRDHLLPAARFVVLGH